ncbi:MAG: sugar isomerase, partial [Bacteroidetes bacterium]|nr:sugar isomerase [Bacteroidota bacterium]
MRITKDQILDHNQKQSKEHSESFSFLADQLTSQNIDVEVLVDQIASFQVAIPSWALGAGGTRF